jgi:hypothetical protein
MSGQNKKDPRSFLVSREAIIALRESPTLIALLEASAQIALLEASATKAEKAAKVNAEIDAKVDAEIVTYHSNLTRLLGGGPEARLYLDAVAFWIERQLEENKIDNPTSTKQKTELNNFVEKACELTSLFDSMSLDTAFTLKIALTEDRVPEAERHRIVFDESDFPTEPPYFSGNDVASIFKAQLALLTKIVGDQANLIETRAGPRSKRARDMFVRRVVHQYHNTFGEWPPRGKREDFHGVVQNLCHLAGFTGWPDIEKVIEKAKKQLQD